MNVLGYRSRGWLLIMIVAPFGASLYVFELCPVEPAKKMLLLYALNPNSASCSMQTRVLEKIKK